MITLATLVVALAHFGVGVRAYQKIVTHEKSDAAAHAEFRWRFAALEAPSPPAVGFAIASKDRN